MDNIERIIGKLEEARANDVENRRIMQETLSKLASAVENVASDVGEIKIQTIKTNGRVNGHDVSILANKEDTAKLTKDFTEHNEKGIVSDTRFMIFWAGIGLAAVATITFLAEHFLKLKT